MRAKHFITVVWSVGMMVLNVGWVSGQDFPTKPIRIVAGTPGGGNDLLARLIANGISGPLRQPVIVDNQRPGIIQGENAARAQPDGYTLMLSSSIWIATLVQKAPFDIVRDFTPVAYVSKESLILVVNSSLPVNSVKELIALAKAKPGQLNFGYTEFAGPAYFMMEVFKKSTGTNIVGVAYKGGVQQSQAIIANEIQMVLAGYANAISQVDAGKLKVLAVSTLTPSELLPGVPTIAASGVPGFEWRALNGLWASGKPPVAVVNKLNQEIVRFVRRPETKEPFRALGLEVYTGSPEDFAAFLKVEMPRVAKMFQDFGIKGE